MISTVERRVDPAIFTKLQSRFRAARFKRVLALITDILSRQSECTILDAGGRARYWDMLPQALRPRVHITLLNYGAELAAYVVRERDGLRFEEISGDACSMPQYSDRQFDLAHSNSVIEHVGSYTNMARFADEMRRVGKSVYVQTPNYGFPIDPHYGFPFIHWAPDPLKIWVLTRFKVGVGLRATFREAAMQVDGCRMLGKWTFRSLFPDADYHAEKILVVFTKSHIAVRA